jgi:hypothetical protein
MKGPQPEFDFLTFEQGERFLEAADPEWRPMFTLGIRGHDTQLSLPTSATWGPRIRGHHTQLSVPTVSRAKGVRAI